jgi:hypothetical protein
VLSARAERERDAGEDERERADAAQRRAVAEHEPGEQQRVGRLDLEAERRLDRAGALGAGEEQEEREARAERAERRELRAAFGAEQPAELAAQRQQHRREGAAEARGRRGDEERIGPAGGELRERRHERAVHRAERGEQ